MKKISCIVEGNKKKIKNPKISYILKKHQFFSLTCSKCGSKDEKISKEKESMKMLKILGLIDNIEQYQNTMIEELSQEFRLKEIDKTRSYFIEEMS